jgi:hypothetical protein
MTKASKKKWSTIQEEIKLLPMTTVVAQSPSVTGSKELTTNQTKSNPSIHHLVEDEELFVKPNLCC